MQSPSFKFSLQGQESERILFRRVNEDDYSDWLQFCAETDSLKYIYAAQDLLLTPDKRCDLWFERVFHRYHVGSGGMNALIDKESNKLVGQCGLLIQEVDGLREMEIGYSLMPEFRGRGYATEAATKCRDFAFKNNYSDHLISIIDPSNLSSIAVANRNGMQFYKKTTFKNFEVDIYRISQSEWKMMDTKHD